MEKQNELLINESKSNNFSVKSNKQIEEMAKDLQEAMNFASQKLLAETKAFVKEYHRYHSKNDFDKAHGKNLHELEAEYLTAKGYRKASDVAREICKMLREDLRGFVDSDYLERLIAVYEKKFIGEDINVPTNTEDGE